MRLLSSEKRHEVIGIQIQVPIGRSDLHGTGMRGVQCFFGVTFDRDQVLRVLRRVDELALGMVSTGVKDHRVAATDDTRSELSISLGSGRWRKLP